MKNNKYLMVITSIIAILLAFLVGAIIILLTGSNPIAAFNGIFNSAFGSYDDVNNWITYSLPLILTGLSVGFAYRSGLFNIGAEGQFIVATLVAIYVGYAINLPPGIHGTVALLAAMISGMLWGLIPGVLKAYFGVSEVVVTIMLNYIALRYTNFLIIEYFHSDITAQTPTINASAGLNYTTNGGATINFGFIFVIIAVFIYWFLLNKTVFGYEIKAVGFSAKAADYAGVKTKSRTIWTMVIAGGFAGLAGGIYSLTGTGYLTTSSLFRNFGFDGIAIAMLGQVSAIGILFAGLLLGLLRNGSAAMNIIGIPSEIIDIIIAVIIMFSALTPQIRKWILKKWGGKK